MVLDKKLFSHFPHISHVKHVNPGMGPFLAPGVLFEQTWKRSTGLCYIPNIKDLGPVVSDKKIVSHFPYISLCKILDPRGGAIFGTRGKI